MDLKECIGRGARDGNWRLTDTHLDFALSTEFLKEWPFISNIGKNAPIIWHKAKAVTGFN